MKVHLSDGSVAEVALSSISSITFDLGAGGVLDRPVVKRIRAAVADIFPNPFAATANIEYYVPSKGWAKIDIYDARGGHVRSLVNAPARPGEHRVQWDSRDDKGGRVASGPYLVRISVTGRSVTKRLIFVQ
jgi:flagellar hook assembly protein FlgD